MNGAADDRTVTEVIREVEGDASEGAAAQTLRIRLLGGPAPSLPSRYYVDPGVYEREKAKLFYAQYFTKYLLATLGDP